MDYKYFQFFINDSCFFSVQPVVCRIFFSAAHNPKRLPTPAFDLLNFFILVFIFSFFYLISKIIKIWKKWKISKETKLRKKITSLKTQLLQYKPIFSNFSPFQSLIRALAREIFFANPSPQKKLKRHNVSLNGVFTLD